MPVISISSHRHSHISASPCPEGESGGEGKQDLHRFHAVTSSEPVLAPGQTPAPSTLWFGRGVGGPRASPGFEELQVPPRKRGFQATDAGVLFGLDRFHGADELFEGVQSPALLNQRQGMVPMLGDSKTK